MPGSDDDWEDEDFDWDLLFESVPKPNKFKRFKKNGQDSI